MSYRWGGYYAVKGYTTNFGKKRTIKPMAVNYPKTKILQMLKEETELADNEWDDFFDDYISPDK